MHGKFDVTNYVNGSSAAINSLVPLAPTVSLVVDALIDAVKLGGTIFSCGNGGSACESMHLVEELVARYQKHRPGIRAQHLMDPGILTCWANDYDYQSAFARQMETFGTNKDALVVFSTSGNSPNIIQALESAKSLGTKTIGLLGRDGGKALGLCDLALVVKVEKTSHIQEAHLAILHMVCEALETNLFP